MDIERNFIISAVAVVLYGASCLIFAKFIKPSCTLKTSAVALAISASASLINYCLFALTILMVFRTVEESPIMYPCAIIFGILGVLAFNGLSVLYAFLRKKKMSVKGIVLDIVLAVVSAPLFFGALYTTHLIISDIHAKIR